MKCALCHGDHSVQDRTCPVRLGKRAEAIEILEAGRLWPTAEGTRYSESATEDATQRLLEEGVEDALDDQFQSQHTFGFPGPSSTERRAMQATHRHELTDLLQQEPVEERRQVRFQVSSSSLKRPRGYAFDSDNDDDEISYFVPSKRARRPLHDVTNLGRAKFPGSYYVADPSECIGRYLVTKPRGIHRPEPRF